MAAVVAMSNCCFSVLTSTVKLRCSVSARRRFTTLRGSVRSVAPKAADQRKRVSHSRKGSSSSSTSSDKSNREVKKETLASELSSEGSKMADVFDDVYFLFGFLVDK